jgi:hypothetical protein
MKSFQGKWSNSNNVEALRNPAPGSLACLPHTGRPRLRLLAEWATLFRSKVQSVPNTPFQSLRGDELIPKMQSVINKHGWAIWSITVTEGH